MSTVNQDNEKSQGEVATMFAYKMNLLVQHHSKAASTRVEKVLSKEFNTMLST